LPGAPGDKTKIRVLMLGPATSLRPTKDAECCCDIQGKLAFDEGDLAIAYTQIPNTAKARNQQMQGWGDAIQVDVDELFQHCSSGYTGKGITLPVVQTTVEPWDPFAVDDRVFEYSGTPKTAQTRTVNTQVGTFSPVQWVKDRMNPSHPDSPGANGYVFVCHSQGCNNLMQALNQACKPKAN
jgi:hypothetical protein